MEILKKEEYEKALARVFVSSVEVNGWGRRQFVVSGSKGTIDIKNNVNLKESGVYSVEFAAKAPNGKSSVTYMKVIVKE